MRAHLALALRASVAVLDVAARVSWHAAGQVERVAERLDPSPERRPGGEVLLSWPDCDAVERDVTGTLR